MRALSPLRLLLLSLFAVLLSGCGYNQIQQKDESVKAGWSEVLNQYQRRADLIPNLVNTVKGYAAHEQQVLTDVTEARAKVGQINVNADDAASLQQFQQAQGELSSAVSRLMATAIEGLRRRPSRDLPPSDRGRSCSDRPCPAGRIGRADRSSRSAESGR